ncbi:thioredoxin family protein [Xanthomarina gelatinilytica]|jgi:thioredoxin-related protein|uniref:thioredoxin family protein n=1 Tax=Xanthomarina gelatinilytica TaxID=1137281 RepID=UPI003AA84090
MRKLSLLFLFTLLVNSIYSQNWQTNFDEVKKQAQASNKNIILVFSGSDWCAPCIKLDKEIFKSNEFISYSNEHFILLKADFPRKKQNTLTAEQQEHNRQLAKTYNKNGYFPFVVTLSPAGKVLGQMGYEKISPTEYIHKLAAF